MFNKKIIVLALICIAASTTFCLRYRTFYNEKLWRDNGVESLTAQGALIEYKVLNDEEFDKALRKKLIEEAREIMQASNEELAEELADALQVIDDLAILHGITEQELIDIKAKKIIARGGLSKRHYVIHASYPEDHWMVKHCLKSPGQYPEITL